MKRFAFLFITATLISIAVAENYLINGGQESTINYRLTQRVALAGDTKSLKLSFVVPENFTSPTYNQLIENFRMNTEPRPSKQKEKRDKRGNRIIEAEWNNPSGEVDVTIAFTARNRTVLQSIASEAPFPPKEIPGDVRDYLKATDQVQSSDTRISGKARELTRDVTTQFDAVQRILTWIVDNMRYVTPPVKYDALYSFENGKGNCQNYSHLSAALMRAVGIPARIVNGVTLNQPYTVKSGNEEFTFKMGQGRHSWIEVYFPDLGWVPFDPQQTELFVSNRFIRVEVGLDNEETVNDGLVRFRQAKHVKAQPRFQEVIEADFPQDMVNLTITKQAYGPQNMLLCPDVRAVFQPVVVPPPPPPVVVSDDEIKQTKLDKPVLLGNLDYPRNINFAFTRGPAREDAEGNFEMRKNFLVETAEYVTTRMTQYAQIVVLDKPLRLQKVGLALHKFGGGGQLWIDLMEDDNGKPGRVLATSDFLSLDQVAVKPGYDWVDFDFGTNPPVLSPGKVWIGLGFTGSPIVNWFYTYGKSVGPVDGTRYKDVYGDDWSGALAYEFNYRVAGWTTR